MTRRTQAQWRELIQQQLDCGLSAAEFCRQIGQNAKYFSLQKQHLAKLDSPFFTVKKPQLLALAPSNSMLRLTFASTMLDLPSSVNPAWLAHLLKELS